MAFLLGMGMVFLGSRFFFAPEVATAGFGIHFNESVDYSFQHIKGIRDIFSGILLCTFVLLRQPRAVGITLLVGGIIPLIDTLVVLSKPDNSITQVMPHIMAIIVCFLFGLLLLITKNNALSQ